jgi:uncharacterized membrane protein
MDRSMLIFFIFLTLMAIDLPMIYVLYQKYYKNMYEKINTTPPDKQRGMISGMIVYIAMAVGLYVFVIQPSLQSSLSTVLAKGMLFGAVLAIVYDLTNLAVITQFGVKEACIDIVWLTFLCGIISVGAVYANRVF